MDASAGLALFGQVISLIIGVYAVGVVVGGVLRVFRKGGRW